MIYFEMGGEHFLGREDFADYIVGLHDHGGLCDRAVKNENIDFLKYMKIDHATITDKDTIRLVSSQKQEGYTEMLKVIYFVSRGQFFVYGAIIDDIGGCKDYTFSDGHSISDDTIGFYEALRTAILKECVESKKLKKKRQELKARLETREKEVRNQ